MLCIILYKNKMIMPWHLQTILTWRASSFVYHSVWSNETLQYIASMYNCTLMLLNHSNKLISSQRTYIIFPSNICTTSMSVYTLPTTTTCKSCSPIVASHMAQILPTSMSIYTLPITCFFKKSSFFLFLFRFKGNYKDAFWR